MAETCRSGDKLVNCCYSPFPAVPGWSTGDLVQTIPSYSLDIQARMNQEDKQRNYELAENLISEQNFAAAVIVGGVATLLATAIYGITTAIWNFSFGFAAAGIGIAVGISMQYLGRGIKMKFAVAASLYTIAGCLLGNVFGVVMQQVRGNAISPLDVFRSNELSVIAGWSVSYVSFVDLVFWFVAVFAAVFLAMRPLPRSERLAIGTYKLKG